MNDQYLNVRTPARVSSADEAAVLGGVKESGEAYVIDNVLVSMFTGVSSENKEIILDIIQYATSKAKGTPKSLERYEVLINAMRTCGLAVRSGRYGHYQAADSRLTMDKLGLNILASLISSATVGPLTGKLLLELASKALDNLKSQDKPLKLFQRASKPFDDVNYAVMSCVENAEGDVMLAAAIVSIDVSVSATNVLFWEFNGASAKIERGEHIFQFNRRQWRRAEKNVNAYLEQATDAAFEKFKW